MPTTNRYFRYFTYIEPVIRTPIIRTYGSLILTILTLSVFIIFAIKPTVETILVLQKKLADQNQILNKLSQKSQNLSSARKNYQSLDPLVKSKIKSAVPTTPQVSELTKSLENAAKTPQASISAIQFQNFTISKSSTKKAALTEIPFTLGVESNYSDLFSILGNLNTIDRLISFNEITFNKIEGERRLIMLISGKAYYLK